MCRQESMDKNGWSRVLMSHQLTHWNISYMVNPMH